jgi:hypothetical protein
VTRGGRGGGGGGRPTVVPVTVQVQTPATLPLSRAPQVSIFDRLGTTGGNGNGQNSNGTSGTKITISHLNQNITTADIAELCGSLGEVKQVEMKHDRHGNPLV